MSIFDDVKVESAEVYNKNKFLCPGEYTVRVDACIGKKVRTSKADAYIVEAEIVTSTNTEEHPVGSKTAFFIDLSSDMGASNLKKIALAMLGVDMTDVSKVQAVCGDRKDKDGKPLPSLMREALEASVGESQRLRGKIFCVSAELGQTKKGNPFTYLNYRPAPRQVEAA